MFRPYHRKTSGTGVYGGHLVPFHLIVLGENYIIKNAYLIREICAWGCPNIKPCSTDFRCWHSFARRFCWLVFTVLREKISARRRNVIHTHTLATASKHRDIIYCVYTHVHRKFSGVTYTQTDIYNDHGKVYTCSCTKNHLIETNEYFRYI